MNRTNKYLIVILAVAVLARVGVALYLGNEVDAPPLLTDQRSYHALGQRLITGHGFSFDTGWYPFTQPNTPTAHWSFLYSLFVAAVYAVFGPQVLAARLVQAVLGGLLLPWLVFRLARRIMGAGGLDRQLARRHLQVDQVAVLAAGIAAVYFYFVLYAATVMTETFFISALLWSLERAIALAERPSLKRALWLGLSLGVATLLRQSILPWAVVLAAWLLWTAFVGGALKRMARALIVAGAVVAAMIAPFTLRNYLVYGQFLLLNSNAGYAMYSAQHPNHGVEFQAFVGMPLPDDLSPGLNEAQLDKELMARGVQFVLADPVRYLRLSWSRIFAYFEFWPTADTSLLNNLGRVGSFGLFLPFMIGGLIWALRAAGVRAWGGWRKFSITPLALLSIFMAVYAVMHIFTWAMPRYRLPVDAAALPFAALALSLTARWVTERGKARSAVKPTHNPLQG